MNTTFKAAYADFLTGCVGNDHADNYDWRRYGPEPRSTRQKLVALARKWMRRIGLGRLASVKLLAAGQQYVAQCADEMEWLYQHLEDEESRELLVRLMAYRALGHRRVKLPLNRPEHWKSIAAIEKSAEGRETIDPGFFGFLLTKLDLRTLGYPIELFFVPFAAITQFVDEPYRCVTPERAIEAEEGDTVIDAGGCWADTALYFASRVGERGKVASFEFVPENVTIFQRNLQLNPTLAGRVQLLTHPVWSSSGQALFISGKGPAASVGPTPPAPGAQAVHTLSIDGLLERGDLDRVDFIKMDIEGAELPALRGAEAALRRFRPKLAISVYHRLSDFWQIPQYLHSLGLGYKFHLRHFTIHVEETVLFAAV